MKICKNGQGIPLPVRSTNKKDTDQPMNHHKKLVFVFFLFSYAYTYILFFKFYYFYFIIKFYYCIILLFLLCKMQKYAGHKTRMLASFVNGPNILSLI